MTHSHSLCPSLVLLGSLVAMPACTGGKLDDGGEKGTATDTDPDTGTETTPPPPTQCGYEGAVLEEGEEVDSADGCVTYVCTGGALTVSEDHRATVAGDLELATQEAVDEQICLGVVEGTLRITGTAADLTPLRSLYRVGGGLEITASAAQTLDGLDGIGEVSGSVTIASNAGLTALAFQPFMSVFGDVTIDDNDALASLAGAEFIGQCGSCLVVDGRPEGLAEHAPVGADEGEAEPAGDGGLDQPQGGTFYGNILVTNNDVLVDVQAIGTLYFAWSDVRFRNNAALTSLLGLQLIEVQGSLEISDHPLMSTTEAEGFAAGINVLGTTTICGNLDGVPCG